MVAFNYWSRQPDRWPLTVSQRTVTWQQPISQPTNSTFYKSFVPSDMTSKLWQTHNCMDSIKHGGACKTVQDGAKSWRQLYSMKRRR